MALSAPAFAAAPEAPAISPTAATFTIPSPGTSMWSLRLWSDGTLEGSADGTSGKLTVPVPFTLDCAFQADVTVTPVGGVRSFYSGARAKVSNCGPAGQTISGHIYLCTTTGAQTTTEEMHGTLATTGPDVLSISNPLEPTKVPSGTYTMTATPPPTFHLVACGGSATVGAGGTTASEQVTVPVGGPAAGILYVAAPTSGGSPGGGSGSPGGPGPGQGPPTSPGHSGPSASIPRPAVPAVTRVAGPKLAFTGLNVAPFVLAGILALALGALATSVSRIRRRTLVVDGTDPRPRS